LYTSTISSALSANSLLHTTIQQGIMLKLSTPNTSLVSAGYMIEDTFSD